MQRDEVAIEVVSDVVCPWCFVGKRQLDRALAQVPEVAFRVTWSPFDLDPTVPREGRDARAYEDARFGDNPQFRAMRERLVLAGAALGIRFAFEAQTRRPSTVDAHRVIRWASAEGVGDAVVDAIFRAYFEEGRDVGDAATLVAIAAASGLDGARVAARLATDEDEAVVEDAFVAARTRGVTGVPSFFVGGHVLTGAQDAATMALVLRRVAAGG